MSRWTPLAILASAQFVMVLDQAVMNVSISQLVSDLDTTVTAIQGVITLYSLVMAMFMLTGGKIGDLIGRRRAFVVGLVVYAAGSTLTALAPNVAVLAVGWSVMEGLGAALVLPALAALVAGSYVERDRAVAYAVIGGVAGAGIAVGPILGGWATTALSWRVVFVGEVVIVVAILLLVRRLADVPSTTGRPRLDLVGSALSALGLGAVVLGVLRASTWGWVVPKTSPIEPFGFALTPFVIGAGAALLWFFVRWQRRRELLGTDPLVRLGLLKVLPLRAGLQTFLAMNLILMGVFFTVPLYLQLVLGLDALQTGLRMLPVSLLMFLASIAGSSLSMRFAPRSLVRAGLVAVIAATVWLLTTVRPTLDELAFAIAMGLLGLGLGLMASQLGNVIQSSVGAAGRSEAGGLQYTAQQLGSALGVALVGAIVLSGLVSNFLVRIEQDPAVPSSVVEQAEVAVDGTVSFVTAEQVRQGAVEAGVDTATADALVADYEDAQLFALKGGLLAAAVLAICALPATRNLPHERPRTRREPPVGTVSRTPAA
ncbi:MFS transporter [Egicoccus sp. AB-alg2]|uniref:MFS transporter n=1 Tax=Egicoccus sp. AB-alg2 TaxID=3242693 RepID=UPI00359D8848